MRTLLTSTALALLLAACSGEVTDGGTGSDTDFEALAENEDAVLEENQIEGQPLQGEPVQQTAERAEDYPGPGEEMTRNPIEPGNEEPGGKDQPLAKELAAMGIDAPAGARADIEAAREGAAEPTVTIADRVYLSYAGVSASGLIGTDALMSGEAAGEVEDVVLSTDGGLVALTVREEGPLGVNGQQLAVAGPEVAFERAEADAPRLSAVLRSAPESFEEDALPSGALFASEMIGERVEIGLREDGARIVDVVMSTDGQARDVALDYAGQRYLVPFTALLRAQGDGGFYLETEEDALEGMPVYVGEPAYSAD